MFGRRPLSVAGMRVLHLFTHHPLIYEGTGTGYPVVFYAAQILAGIQFNQLVVAYRGWMDLQYVVQNFHFSASPRNERRIWQFLNVRHTHVRPFREHFVHRPITDTLEEHESAGNTFVARMFWAPPPGSCYDLSARIKLNIKRSIQPGIGI